MLKVKSLLGEAQSAWNEGRALDAGRLYQRVLELDSAQPIALQRLAWIAEDRGQLPLAVSLLQRLLVVRPEDARGHLNLGLCLRKMNRLEEALAAMRQAVRINPSYAAGHCNLGLLLENRGEIESAVASLKIAVDLAPDSAFYRYHLAAVGGTAAPGVCPPDYLVSLFDGYADSFDQHLFQTLGYQGPQLLADAVASHGLPKPWDILDLGCGTGMTGVAFHSNARSIIGVDLSPRMLHYAGLRSAADGTRIYNALLETDVVAAQLERPLQFELILAADVFIYLGDLHAVLSAGRGALRPGGLIAFTIESFDGTADFILRPTRRYAQSSAYITRLAGELQLNILEQHPAVLRRGEQGEAVDGIVYVLQKPFNSAAHP